MINRYPTQPRIVRIKGCCRCYTTYPRVSSEPDLVERLRGMNGLRERAFGNPVKAVQPGSSAQDKPTVAAYSACKICVQPKAASGFSPCIRLRPSIPHRQSPQCLLAHRR